MAKRVISSYIFKLAGLLVAAFAFAVESGAQVTDILLAQYRETLPLYNPAATGSTDYLRIRAGARLQWLGIDNAPMNFVGVADMPLQLGKQKLGVGVIVNQGSLGLFRNLDIGIQASYRRNMLKGTVSVGIQGNYFHQKFKGSDIFIPDDDDYHDSGDEALPTQDVAGAVFDLGAGVWYQRTNWWVGVSGLHLLNPTVKMKIESTSGDSADMEYFETELPRTLYFMAGGNIPIKNTLFELQPSMLIASDFTDVTGEADLGVRYNKMVTLSAGYRWKSALKVGLSAEIKDFFIGYAYEYPLSSIAKASSGSHEILAGYRVKIDFNKATRNKHRSIRLM